MLIKELLDKLCFFKRWQKNRKKTILFAPLDSAGHINSLVSIANHLKSQGHRTVFLFMDPIANTLTQQGHEVYDSTTPDLAASVESDAAQDKWNEVIAACQEVWSSGDVMRNLEVELKLGFSTMIDDIKKRNSNIEEKLKLIKPDLLVIDHYFGIPALFKANLPWIRIFSAAPLALHDNPDLAAPWLGLPTIWNKDDPKQRDYVERSKKARKELYDSYNSYWRSFDLPDLPTQPISYIPVSPYLNIYMYPEELDYLEGGTLKDWQRCDCMVRDQKAVKFEVPEKLRGKPGKLIFLSLGSLASADVQLMKRLTSLLADSPHRFIVSKGPLHNQYDLPDNMWGDKFLPQLEILTCVDLIITHGGNNTLTESFYYGVPGFVICPLFGDQFDNATRVEEKGFGIRLDPYNCTKEQLLEAVEKVLGKEDIKPQIKAISERMQKPEARNRSIKLVSDLVEKL